MATSSTLRVEGKNAVKQDHIGSVHMHDFWEARGCDEVIRWYIHRRPLLETSQTSLSQRCDKILQGMDMMSMTYACGMKRASISSKAKASGWSKLKLDGACVRHGQVE